MTAPPRVPRARALSIVIGGLAAAGVAVGGLWAWLAPPVHGVVALARSGERIHAYLGNEHDHFFDAAFLMLGMLVAVAVVAAAAVWQWRAHRGPAMVVAFSAGTVGAGVLATVVGELLVAARYGTVDVAAAPVTPDDRIWYFTQAPGAFFGPLPLQLATTVVLPAAAGALAYAVGVVAAVRDDLGAYPPEPLTAGAGGPPARSAAAR
ncbi:DUF2567 domain-containing protein [Mycolicibacillus trivialis]|uniref:DUF2567 domain-containing protein n=1 Tax=Mycolicibacillus trivialis TaxID=1798 RepID=A0A1X2EPN5_9MYCO|nr:DUF2567 domain-containing protein [Mycolicibacillus trivialis]ORX08057.1 hypothetical protein AWC30_03870 [Mycolicibacillus trivialis]